MGVTKLVTLDVTNTVIRTLGGVGKNYASVASLYGVQVEPAKIDQNFKQMFKRYNEKYPNFGVKSGLTPFRWWTDLVVDCFVEAGHPKDERLTKIAQHLYIYFKTSKGWEVLPGAVPLLTKLKNMDIKVGVISNFDERLEKVLESLAIRHFFTFVLASAVIGEAKPGKEIFDLALDVAEVNASEAVHVGDNVLTDYHGARGAGFTGVLLHDKDKAVPDDVDPQFVINDVQDVLKFV